MVTPLYKLSFGLVLLLALVGCRSEPDYSVIPNIDFENIKSTPVEDETLGKGEMVTIEISYRDGDGNLGLDTADIRVNPLYRYLKPDGTINRFYNNFFVSAYVKEGNAFVPFDFPNPNFNYSGRFMRLTNDLRIEPLEGTLRYTFRVSPLRNVKVGSVVKFRVSIADRALNESNTVETEELTLLFSK